MADDEPVVVTKDRGFLQDLAGYVGSKLPPQVSQIAKISQLSEEDIKKGLKEALQKGIEKAVSQVSVDNGYYRDKAIRILLPPEAETITKNISKLPHGDELIDNVIKNMNAAASDAAKEVTPIFIDAIKSINIQDAKNILLGEERAATMYFKDKTNERLKGLFQPKIDESMNKKIVGDYSAASSWSSLMTQWNKLASSTIGKIAKLKEVDTDITSYVTTKAMDGLFTKIGDEEKEIRSNLNEQTTELLRKVFGALLK
ncbi:hypothetical protein M9Y10_020577 [Tritrichomonas musculus]|uniref:DUF4197 domain-containing protein n=1 Tax=Tritrichomonas musculus TaxID=1915356 RepID=A0ABR2GIZ8_9EUKA